MGLELPGPLVWVLNLVGINWPNVDEDQLRSAASELRQFSQELTSNSGDAQAGIQQMLSNNSSQSLELFQALWNKLSGSHLPQMATAMGVVGDALDVGAVIVVGLKAAAIAQLAMLAAEIISNQAEAVVTFGASEALIPVETMATREIMKTVMDQAIQQLEQQLMSAVEQPVINALTSAADDLAQQLVGDALGVSSGVNVGAVAQAGASGFGQGAQGLVSDPLGAMGVTGGGGQGAAQSGGGAGWPNQTGVLKA